MMCIVEGLMGEVVYGVLLFDFEAWKDGDWGWKIYF